ncbi:MAG: M20 family metallo-hydrolase [Treponema sp.]|nr:M20 family metallo-hydrolase [Treponema sp.]
MKEKIFEWLENSSELAIDLETGLTKHPAISPDSGGEGELDKCLFLETWLKNHGVTNLKRYDCPDIRAKGGARPNLIAVIEGEESDSKGCFWILSHMDVVPPGEIKLWHSDPWTCVKTTDGKGTCLTGRGVEDNQQGMVSSALAALAFVKLGIKPKRSIKLLFASDEEVGSVYGIEWLVKNHRQLFDPKDMVLVPDGGDVKGECIEIAEKNIMWMRFNTRGRQAHASMPELGVNAFIAASDLVTRLHNDLSLKFNKRDPLFDPDYSTFMPTKKEANVPNINTIPGDDVFYVDMRVLPVYPPALILAEVDKIKSEIEEKYRVTVEYSMSQMMESKPTRADSPIVKLLSSAAGEVYKVKPRLIGIGGGTMAASLRNIGIDCAVWTKTDETLHQPNEYVLIDNIIGDAKVMALIAISN